MNDDITVVSSQALRALMTAVSVGDNIHSRPEIVLNDDAENYLRAEALLDILGASGPLRDIVLSVRAGGGLQRATANEDMYLKMRMLDTANTSMEHYTVRPASDAPEPVPYDGEKQGDNTPPVRGVLSNTGGKNDAIQQ